VFDNVALGLWLLNHRTVVRLRSASRRLSAFDRLGPRLEPVRSLSDRLCDALAVDTSRQPNSVNNRHGVILMSTAWIQKFSITTVSPSSAVVDMLTVAMDTRSYVTSYPLSVSVRQHVRRTHACSWPISPEMTCTNRSRVRASVRVVSTFSKTPWLPDPLS